MMKTVINLADRLQKAEALLWEYVEQDECVCEDREDWRCLLCQATDYLIDHNE